ncbi:flagellar basal body-associated FliL family protein [Azospirillum thermophilum]|uniref:Flagellar protein FliL n=1 Tax=Azospirillum thermophilum TaxID=2202148 RepID=A0A2S2CUS6_9PROT|nr:flagellar basal body-associated FliL family protein [Azospirillum thermophilum]AWK88262.1 flagellar basal body protein FliL [Azospirillum thermophilum]
MNTDAEGARAVLSRLLAGRRVLVVVLPLARLTLGLAVLAGVIAAGIGGYWMAVGTDRVLALFTPSHEVERPQVTLDLPEVIVNLRLDTPSRYLKIGITLSIAPQDRARVESVLPYLVDAQQEFLRNIDQHDLQGSNGLYRLRTELRRRFNLIIGRDAVIDVLLRSLLTQ